MVIVDGNKVRAARERRLISQENMARRAGLTESTLNRIERGLQQPRLSTVAKLAAALGVTPEEILANAPVTPIDN